MGKTSSAVKRRYNQKAYKSFTAQIKPDLFERIAAYCEQNGLSRSQFLLQAINNLAPAEIAAEIATDEPAGE